MTRYALLFASLLPIACVTPDQPEPVPPDTPVTVHTAAQALLGRQHDAVIVDADATVADFALDTQSIRSVAQRARDAVVSIYVKTSEPYRIRLLPFRIPWTGFPIQVPGEALGSGFFVHPDGYLLTNHHVIKGATDIQVRTSKDEDYSVTIIAEDPVYDLALLKVSDSTRQFTVLPTGRSELVEPGELVIAVGNPLGLGHTVTQGIISHTGRTLTTVEVENGRQVEYLQTSTAINPGSSGGPLITLTGAWVGVNTAGYTQAQGLGFAVPSRQVREFLFEVLAGGTR